MYPQLFKLPWLGWPINSYGFMIMVGFLLATYLGVRRGKQLGIKPDIILDVGIISMIFGILGAKVNYLLQYPEHFGDGMRVFDFGDGGLHWGGALLLGPLPFAVWYWRTQKESRIRLLSWQNGVLMVATLFAALIGTRSLFLYLHRADYRWSVFESWQSGFVLYGGLVCAILAGILYTRMRGESIARIADLSAPLIMIGVAFGRVGCFLNGCCYGKIWENGFCAVRFPQGSAPWEQHRNAQKLEFTATQSMPVMPTQLFETAATLLFFVLLTWYDRRKKKHAGETLLVGGALYSVWRFIVEILRDDPRPTWLGELTFSQTVSIGVFLVCAVWWALLRMRPVDGGSTGSGTLASDRTVNPVAVPKPANP